MYSLVFWDSYFNPARSHKSHRVIWIRMLCHALPGHCSRLKETVKLLIVKGILKDKALHGRKDSTWVKMR